MALQPISGYPSDYRAPFTAAEINFAQGPSTASLGPRTALYIGPKLSSAAAIAGTVYQIVRESEAVDYFGVGSPLHRMLRLHLMVNPLGVLYGMAYAPSSGSGIATATGTITLSGTVTAKGLLETYHCGEQIITAFTSTDTPTTIGDILAAQINAKTYLPYTAANATGTVTLTAKVAGASQGDGTVGVLRFRARVITIGTGLSVATSGAALGLGTGTPGADGATTETANFTAALANITARRFYYMGTSIWSSAGIAPLKTHIATKSDPNPGRRSRGFTGYTHTLSSLATIAIGSNYERRHFVWQENSEQDTAELVAQMLALHQKYEAQRGGFVADGYRGIDSQGRQRGDWLLKPAYAEADWPTATEVNDAIVDGIIPIASDQGGSYMVMSVNSRSKNTAGTIDDFRATETHRVSFMDDFCDTWLARHGTRYQGFKIQDDIRKQDGSLDVNAVAGLPGNTLTPSRYFPFAADLVDEFTRDGVLQGAEAWRAALKVNIDPLNVSRLEVGASGRTADLHHQTTIRLNETSPG